MDEWRVWDSARSASGLACLKDWGLTGAEPGLLTHWGMNDDTGDTAVDGTGGGQDGTLSADTSWVSSPMGLTAFVGGDIGCLDFDGDGDTPDDGDCDDTDPAVNTTATEICDGIDSDCDGATDPDTSADAGTWYGDSDGLGDAADPQTACTQPSGTVENSDDACPAEDASACDLDSDGCLDDVDGDGVNDCDDTEECDGQDNDGDGLVDDDDPDVTGQSLWYADEDADSYGDAGASTVACDAPASGVADDKDCDDGDPAVNPGATELWYDGTDQDCDGNDDDQDVDGHGWDGVAGGDDCDDEDATVYPGAADTWYDGVDSDCLGNDDDDADGDGYGSASHGGGDSGAAGDKDDGCGCSTRSAPAGGWPLLALLGLLLRWRRR
jgi:MYXO-CTERM domain-containing protein